MTLLPSRSLPLPTLALATLAAAMLLTASTAPARAQAQDGQTGRVSQPHAGAGGGAGDLPPALQHLARHGAHLTPLGRAHGLEAYIAQTEDGSRETLYVTPDGQAIVTGLMFDGQGYNVTKLQLGRLLQEDPDALAISGGPSGRGGDRARAGRRGGGGDGGPPTERVLVEASDSHWFRVGADDAPVLYMIADANCPYCAEAWQDLREPIESGRVQLRMIMTGRLSRSSLPKAAAIVAADNPGRAFNRFHGSRSEDPGQIDPGAALKVRENESWSGQYGLTATPTFIFRDRSGRAVVNPGLPRDIDGTIISRLAPPARDSAEGGNAGRGAAE